MYPAQWRLHACAGVEGVENLAFSLASARATLQAVAAQARKSSYEASFGPLHRRARRGQDGLRHVLVAQARLCATAAVDPAALRSAKPLLAAALPWY